MTTPRTPDLIVASWLDEGPNELPDVTRRAITVGLRTTGQRRRGLLAPWWDPAVHGMAARLALGAMAVVVALGGLYLYGNRGRESPGVVGGQSSPSSSSPVSAPPSPSPGSGAIPALTETFVSPYSGYTVRYPTGWTPEDGPRPWTVPSNEYPDLDFISGRDGGLRSGSIMAPEDASIDDWIDRLITTAMDSECNRWRVTLPTISIDGQEGRVRETCEGEVEATVVIGRRVYLFTLFSAQPNVGAVFDAFAATIELRPEDAFGTPSPTP